MNLPTNNYISILSSLKEKIRQARLKAALNVNAYLLQIYWEIGKIILEQQKSEGWGAKIIDDLTADLKLEFPDMKGFSRRNLQYMRAFAESYPDLLIVQPAAAQLDIVDYQETKFVQSDLAQIPWTHHIVILDKVKSPSERLFYIHKTIENNWSKNILSQQIESNLFQRQGKAITNFTTALPAPQSDLANETLKNPYVFDFLSLSEDIKERELERAMILHLKKFMLELGKGFAYVGNQKNLVVDGDDFFLDLLFYNYHLHCFVVFELKVGDFKPEFAGKLNFYVNTINEQLKGIEDKPTIGVLLCKTPNETVVRYSLQGIESPIGVADYQLTKALPTQLKGEIPTIEELESEIEKEYEELKSPADKKIDRIKDLVSKLGNKEEPKEQNPENMIAIFQEVVIMIKNKLESKLKEIIDLFDKTEVLIWVNNKGYKNEPDAFNELIQIGTTHVLYLEFSLKGFKKAGTNIFSCQNYLYFNFEPYKYSCSSEQNRDIIWEKLYQQRPGEEEIKGTIDNFILQIGDKIESNLERLKLL